MNNLLNKKILVTGGSGFIGSFVVSELLKETVSEVVIFDNLSRGNMRYVENQLKDPRCSLVQGDLRELDVLNAAIGECDYVIHLAAMWLLHCKDFPRTAFDVNIQGTFNVLEACVNNNIERLIYSSSASVYGDAVKVPMTEEHPFNNRNFYGASKIACEAMCRAFYDRYGLNYVGLRYMNVYGPHQDQTAAYTGVIPIMLNKIDANEAPVINGNGTQAYDFIYVEDVARANVLALKSSSTDEFYNVGSGVQTSIADLCDLILSLKNSDLKVQYNPYNEDDARRLVQNRIGCPEKASQDLDFNYTYSLKDGLKKLINWRENNKNS